MNIHKNPINSLLQQAKQQQQPQQHQQLNPYATTGIFQHNHSPPQTITTLLPTYVSLDSCMARVDSHRFVFSPNRCDRQRCPFIIIMQY